MMYSNYTIPLMDSDSDSTAIQNAIRLAIETGCGCVLIPPKKTPDGEIIPWQIDHTILLPSNITIVLDGCHLRLKDNVFENIFRSENMFHADRYSLEYEQRNIQIIGLRNATLDGGLPNGLTEATSNRDGFPSIRYNCLILLHNVNGYVIEGIRLINQRCGQSTRSIAEMVGWHICHSSMASSSPIRTESMSVLAATAF